MALANSNPKSFLENDILVLLRAQNICRFHIIIVVVVAILAVGGCLLA